MFFKILDSIRKKPSHIRSLIALVASLSITGVIAFFWAVSYVSYTQQVFSEAGSPEKVAAKEKGPIARFTASVSSGFQQMKEQVSGFGFGNATSSDGSSQGFAASGNAAYPGASLDASGTATSTGSATADSGISAENASTTPAGQGIQPNNSNASTSSRTQNLIEYATSTR